LGSELALVSGAGANVVVLAAADALLLVDGGSAQHSAALERLLAERWPGRRVEILFNTNWRDEHTGGNAARRAAGAAVMAHENTKLWLGGDFFVEWEDRHYTPRAAAELPNKTFYKSGSVDFGGRRVDYWYVPRAHTDGDVAVFFGDANVLVASDLLSVGRYPVPDYSTGGWIGGFVDGSKKLLESTDAKTRIVAASGGVYGRAELEAQLQMCTAVRSQAAAAFRAGMSLADFVASKPTAAFDERWGDPRQFLPLVYKGGFAHLRELGGVI
jgi:glyoxylase-like metal-dependent hydrolase (beta-lactamase superfamily II)